MSFMIDMSAGVALVQVCIITLHGRLIFSVNLYSLALIVILLISSFGVPIKLSAKVSADPLVMQVSRMNTDDDDFLFCLDVG